MKPGDTFVPYRRFVSAPVPIAVMANPSLSAGAKLLYARLSLYAGKDAACYPSLVRLAADLGASLDCVSRYLRELIAAKLIRRKRRGPAKTAACEFVWQPWLDSANPRIVDSAETQNQDSAESQNLDSAETRPKIPHFCGSDSAESRNHLKEETVQLNGSVKTTAVAQAVREYFPATSEGLIGKIAAAARQAVPDASDDEIALAIHRAKRPEQYSPKLFLNTLPVEIAKVAYYGRPSHLRPGASQ